MTSGIALSWAALMPIIRLVRSDSTEWPADLFAELARSWPVRAQSWTAAEHRSRAGPRGHNAIERAGPGRADHPAGRPARMGVAFGFSCARLIRASEHARPYRLVLNAVAADAARPDREGGGICGSAAGCLQGRRLAGTVSDRCWQGCCVRGGAEAAGPVGQRPGRLMVSPG